MLMPVSCLQPRPLSTVFVRCIVLVALVFSSPIWCRIHNFASLDVLSDGLTERFIHYNGLTVKETLINSSDNSISIGSHKGSLM
ncbi:hypothetical protein M8J76_005440 [Diaphorina citri]|nr:hypothetical protein M8J76_005440 [Diaphorina citri]